MNDDDDYWTLVDETFDSKTWVHRMENGMLVRVRTQLIHSVAEALTFVPSPPHTQGPYR